MSKIVGSISKYLKVDQATMNREKLLYVRVLVEVEIDQYFSDVVKFRNERDVLWSNYLCTMLESLLFV